jgi:hypothetical protein
VRTDPAGRYARPMDQVDEQQETTYEDLTGVTSVDAVIRSLDRLDERPLADHVGLFEEAHAALRTALDAPQTSPMPRPDLGERAGA